VRACACMVKSVFNMMTLLLPALIPSWRFFDTVKPSPRIEYILLTDGQGEADEGAQDWQELYPKPDSISVGQLIRRMVWNPRWNEALFLVSLAERMSAEPSDFVEQELTARVLSGLKAKGASDQHPFMQYRVAFVLRVDGALEKHVTYQSPVHRVCGGGDEL